MKAAPFAYERPASLNAAIALMAEAKGAAKIMAGGQSLGPMLNLRLVQPDLIIDITGLAELKHAEQSRDELVIGACVTHGDIEDGRIPDVTHDAMRRVAGGIAYRAVRNRGTIGGSVAHGDPAADLPAALMALRGTVIAEGPAESRVLIGIEMNPIESVRRMPMIEVYNLTDVTEKHFSTVSWLVGIRTRQQGFNANIRAME